MNNEVIAEEAAAEAAPAPHLFAAGQEVIVQGDEKTRAKVVAQSHDETGAPVYEVVYAVRATLPESELSAVE